MSRFASQVVKVVTSADVGKRMFCTRAKCFQFISEVDIPIPMTFSVQSTRPQVPVYLTAIYGVGALVATKQVDAGRSQGLTVYGSNILFELEVDERFWAGEESFDVMIGVGEGGAEPRAIRSVRSLDSETIAPAGEWVVPIPAGARDVSAVVPATGATVTLALDAFNKGYPITSLSQGLTRPLPLPMVGEQNVRVINTGGLAIPRPTLVFGIE